MCNCCAASAYTPAIAKYARTVFGYCFSAPQRSALDALARMMMKGAVKCGKHTEEQQPVSEWMSEPGLSFQDFSE